MLAIGPGQAELLCRQKRRHREQARSYRSQVCHSAIFHMSNLVGANSFAKAVCQAQLLFKSIPFAYEFAPTGVSPLSMICKQGSCHA